MVVGVQTVQITDDFMLYAVSENIGLAGSMPVEEIKEVLSGWVERLISKRDEMLAISFISSGLKRQLDIAENALHFVSELSSEFTSVNLMKMPVDQQDRRMNSDCSEALMGVLYIENKGMNNNDVQPS